MTTAHIIKQCRKSLEACYGPRLKGLVLYGSVARNQTVPGSDIDLLVLLDQPFDYFEELRRIVDLLYPVQLESQQLISARPALWEQYEQGSIQLYRHAKRDGVLV